MGTTPLLAESKVKTEGQINTDGRERICSAKQVFAPSIKTLILLQGTASSELEGKPVESFQASNVCAQ